MRTIDQTTQEVLTLASKHFQVPANSLAPDDDFFKKLGIDSLQALELLSRLENHFGIELPDKFAPQVCLIESDRERETERLTYRDFKERAHPLAKALQDSGLSTSSRAAIIMTNQSNWLIAAYVIFFSGRALVPPDYKLTPQEQWQLLKHSSASVLITEYPIWRQLAVSALRDSVTNLKTILVTEAPPNADLSGALRWEEFRSAAVPAFIRRKRSDVA